jgi:hypothetical protein
MSFTTISPTYTILVRRSLRIKSFQGLITKEMEPNLNGLFNEDMGNSSNPINDEEEALHEVFVEQLSKLDNQFDNF